MPTGDHRLEQLIATQALAVSDRVRRAAESASDLEGAGPAAVVHLRTHPGGSISDLERVIRLTQTGTGRLVDRLVAAELVERRPGRDGRTQALWLSRAGQAAAAHVLERRAEAVAPLLAQLTAAERADLEGLMARIVAGLADDRPSALTVCRLCDREACRSGPGCPLEHTTEAGG